jgi:hypothetical protein
MPSPFTKAIERHQAALALKRFAERRPGVDLRRAAGALSPLRLRAVDRVLVGARVGG